MTDQPPGPHPSVPPPPPGPPPSGPPPLGPRPVGPPPPPPRQGERNVVPIVVAVIAAVVVLALAIGIPVALRSGSDPEPGHKAGTDPTTAPTADGTSSPPLDLDAVQVYDDLANDHTTDDVSYPQVPPVGGPHDPAWLDCGVYDEPVRDENAVHDLEHGSTWLTYDPALGGDDVAAMAAQLPQNSIVSPYVGLPSPVVVTVWGRQLQLTGPDDPRLGLFVAAFGDGHTSPEPFASCAGGIQDPGGSDAGTSA